MKTDVFNKTKPKELPLGTYHVSYGVGCIDFRAGNNDVKSNVWDHCMGSAQSTSYK